MVLITVPPQYRTCRPQPESATNNNFTRPDLLLTACSSLLLLLLLLADTSRIQTHSQQLAFQSATTHAAASQGRLGVDSGVGEGQAAVVKSYHLHGIQDESACCRCLDFRFLAGLERISAICERHEKV